MPDPFLFELMHHVAPTLSHQQIKDQPDRFTKAYEKAIQEKVDQLFLEESPQNQLVPKNVLREKLEKEVRTATSLGELDGYLSSAASIFYEEGTRYLNKEAQSNLINGLKKINRNLNELDLDTINEEALKKSLLMSEENVLSILKIAQDKFLEGLIKDSLAVFSFLSLIKSDEPEYWYRLGLVAEKENLDSLALKAFSAATELAPDFIGPYIFASECSLKMGLIDQAHQLHAKAKEIFETNPEGEWQPSLEALESLLEKPTF